MRYDVDRDASTGTALVRKVNVGVATGPRGITTNTLGIARHGADANFARPAEFDTVMWVGTVEPNNADLGKDMWVNTT